MGPLAVDRADGVVVSGSDARGPAHPKSPTIGGAPSDRGASDKSATRCYFRGELRRLSVTGERSRLVKRSTDRILTSPSQPDRPPEFSSNPRKQSGRGSIPPYREDVRETVAEVVAKQGSAR